MSTSRACEYVDKSRGVIIIIMYYVITNTYYVTIITYVLNFSVRLKFPFVLIIYQDVIISVHGVFLFVGFTDRSLFCSSEDLIESYQNLASPFCTLSGNINFMYHGLICTIGIVVKATWYPCLPSLGKMKGMLTSQKLFQESSSHFLIHAESKRVNGWWPFKAIEVV